MYKTETPNWHQNMAERHVEKLSQENEDLREQLQSLFERVSGCEVSEFSSEQVNYLSDMIEGQMDANEGCINKIKSENAALREALRLKELECEALAVDKKKLFAFVNLCAGHQGCSADSMSFFALTNEAAQLWGELGGGDER